MARFSVEFQMVHKGRINIEAFSIEDAKRQFLNLTYSQKNACITGVESKIDSIIDASPERK